MPELEEKPSEMGWDPRRAFEVVLGVPATDGNAVRVLRNGDEIFPAMLGAIKQAQRSVDLLTFVYWTGDIAVEFADALTERARAGVTVRVLLNALGARRIDEDLVGQMLDAGCDVKWFRPLGDDSKQKLANRTHRKVLVCDGQVGFTGGVGIAAEWCGDARDETEWRDTHFEVRGPAVDGLRSAFLTNWAETGRPLLGTTDEQLEPMAAAGDSPVIVLADGDRTGPSATALALGLLLDGAEDRVRATTAYFTPDESMLEAICGAARRGVKVQLLIPGEHIDKDFVRWASEADYDLLLEAGVEVCVFEPSMLHAKVMTADGRVAVVGSSNINTRSSSEDDEVLMVVFDPDVVATLDSHFDDDLTRSSPVDPADWAERGILQRAREAVMSKVSDVL